MDKTDIQIARKELTQDQTVIAMVKDGKILFTSSKKGIQPFVDALDTYPREIFSGCSIADRVVGKAALMLAAYVGAKQVYTPLASEHAIKASLDLSLDLIYDKSTAFIINRTQNGMCPMEKSVLDIDDPEEAYDILKTKLRN